MKKVRILSLFALSSFLFGCSFPNIFNKNKKETPQEQNQSSETEKMLVLNTNSISISEEKTFKLEATIDPSLQKYLLFWSIENENVATVDDNGLVTGIKTGYTICTAQCGKYQVRCVVEVTPYVPGESLSVSFEKTEFALNVGDSYKLNTVVKLGKEVITNYSVSAQIENSSVVSFTNETINALSSGESKLLVTYSYLEYSVQQLLNVVVY